MERDASVPFTKCNPRRAERKTKHALVAGQRSLVVLVKEKKVVEANLTRARSNVENFSGKGNSRRLPKFRPPPPSAQQIQDEQFVLTKPQHTQILNSLKKFYNANRQLLAVSRTVAEKIETLNSSKGDFLHAQLQLARQELTSANNAFTENVKIASNHIKHLETTRCAHLSAELASFTSLICTGMKSVAIEAKDDNSIFIPVLTSITTAKDAIVTIMECLEETKEKLNKSLPAELNTFVKKLEFLISSLVARKSGKVITKGQTLEIEAAARAAACSVAKLVRSFSRPIEKSIIYETKVVSCCISQLWATLNELAGSTTMIAHKVIKKRVVESCIALKLSFADFMQSTKDQVSNPSSQSHQIMSANAEPLRSILTDIVIMIHVIKTIDISSEYQDTIEWTGTDEIENARKITGDPGDLVPPPPSMREKKNIDLPDDYIADINPIWEEPESDEGRVLYTESNSIRCATINKLLFRLVEELDVQYLKTFLTTYRSFTTPAVLLQKLVQLFHVPSHYSKRALQIQLRCSNFLKQWVETGIADFDDEIMEMLERFIQELRGDNRFAKFAKTISTKLVLKQEELQFTKNEIVNLEIEEKIPICPATLLFIFPDAEIAKQLTLVDFYIYQAIKPVELLNCAWSKAKYRYRAKNVLALVSRSTSITRWVSSVIIWQNTLRGRIKALTKFINIAKHLRNLNNFNSLMAILAGINTSAVYRLKFTRAGISEESQLILDELSHLMDACQSYSTYRSALHDIDPPCVPFLGTYLTDITFIEDGNADFVQGLINLRKRELVYSVVSEIQQYQQKSYKIELVDGIANYLQELPYNDEEVLYDLSLEREPRQTKAADELI